ncbi:MAG: YciI family protein [Candidatus Binataceae bacterium]
MQYMLLINVPQDYRPSAEEERKMMDEYMTFTQDIVQSGKFKAGNRLEPASTATIVKVRNGKTLTTDGPYAETKEQLGGYYLIEAANLDEAVAIAGRIPGARHGTVEVRPAAQM